MAQRVSTPRFRIRRTTAHARSNRRALPAAHTAKCHASAGSGRPAPSAPSTALHSSPYRSARAAASGSWRSSHSARTRRAREAGDGPVDKERRRERASFGDEVLEDALERRWSKKASSPSSLSGAEGIGWSGSGSKSLWSEGQWEVERRRRQRDERVWPRRER